MERPEALDSVSSELHVRDDTLDLADQCTKDISDGIETVLSRNLICVSRDEDQCSERCQCGGCCEERKVTIRVRSEEPKEEQKKEKAKEREEASVVSFVHDYRTGVEKNILIGRAAEVTRHDG